MSGAHSLVDHQTRLRRVQRVVDSASSNRNQDRQWSRHAAAYDENFLDPFAPGVQNPFWETLDRIPDAGAKTVIDLGCGTGPLLPRLLKLFGRVIALDFAPAMLERARERLGPERSGDVKFLLRTMDDLDDLAGQIDVAITINSLVMPDVRIIDRTLRSVHASLRPAGVLVGIVPSLDAIQYHSMLLLDQALAEGLEMAEAMRFIRHLAEHRYYDFAYGRFRFKGLRQKFWFPFEVEHRLGKSGFRGVRMKKVLYPWDDAQAGAVELSGFPPSWDWFFQARKRSAARPKRDTQGDIAS